MHKLVILLSTIFIFPAYSMHKPNKKKSSEKRSFSFLIYLHASDNVLEPERDQQQLEQLKTNETVAPIHVYLDIKTKGKKK